MRRSPHWTGWVLLAPSLTVLLTACSSSAPPGQDRDPSAGTAPGTDDQQAVLVEALLSTSRADNLASRPRHLAVRWLERMVMDSQGGAGTLILRPLWAGESDASTDYADFRSIPCPREIRCSRDLARPPEHGLVLSVASFSREDEAIDQAAWRAIADSILFPLELVLTLRPDSAEGGPKEWDVALDAARFAQGTRLGAWAEDGLTIRGKASLAADESRSHPALQRIEGTVEVLRLTGETLQAKVSLFYDPIGRELASAVLDGTIISPRAHEQEGQPVAVFFRIRRSLLPSGERDANKSWSPTSR